ncbi:hypothetical protein HBH52_230290 [Parastagonospora nodorum]|nr:hypothetical protein HBH52_230290 [Parastagonospora nodorum]
MSLPAESQSAKGAAAAQLVSKTCQNCFSLKIRCDRTQRQDICDRCARLGKNCVFRPARRRDNSARRDSRIQALEQQVQDLLRLQRPGPIVQQPLPSVNEESNAGVSTSPNNPQDGDVVDEDLVSIERAETLVEVYKTDMMPHFPFVIVPPHVTGSDLRHTKPFLFLAIVSVACFHDLNTQDKLCNRFKHMVSDKVLLGGDDCLELEYIQGLLIVLAWNQYHGRSKYYSQYLQLAISLAVDMRLDRKLLQPKPANAGNKRNPVVEKPGMLSVTWGAEEQRAAAGIFYISSTVSKLFDKTNTFACTQFIEEGTLALREQAEYRTDKDLYHVIRLQRIIEGIDKIATASDSDADAQSAYLRVRTELEEFRVYLCSDVSDSQLLFMQFHTAKLFLYQVAFFERNLQQSPALHRNIICEGLEGAKSFLDLYLWLPPKSEMFLTNTEWIQLNFGVTLAAKFAIISKEPGVEPHTRDLRHRLNIDNVFRHLALRIGALVGRGGEGNKQKDIFFHYESRVRKIQKWYERMIQATRASSPESQASTLQPQAGGVHRRQSPSQPHDSYRDPPSATPSQVPVSATYSHQQPQYIASASYQHDMMPMPQYQQMQQYMEPQIHQQPSVSAVGMAPMSTYSSYSPVPSVAYPDLMSAPGWDNMFTIPMENEAIFDVSQGYGLGMASPPSEASWDSSSVQ